jgi:ubiquitin-like modifier-activating enzyme 5
MGIIAGLLAQNLLKYLLNFGETSYLLSYNAFLNFFDNSELLPNPSCSDDHCISRQKEFTEGQLISRKPVKKIPEVTEAQPFDNEWGIVMDENTTTNTITTTVPEKTVNASTFSIDDLRDKLSGLYKK